MSRNNQYPSKEYCPHGNESDHDWEAGNSTIHVCVATLRYWELDQDVQDRIREDSKVDVMHCMCCHRHFVDAKDGTNIPNDDFGLCKHCHNHECGGGTWNQIKQTMNGCDKWHNCMRPRRCREASEEL